MPRFIKTFISNRISSNNLRSNINSLDENVNKFVDEYKVKLISMQQLFSPPIYDRDECTREQHILRVVFYEADNPIEEKH